MAYTAPRTYVASEVHTAAHHNTYERDNMLETMVGKVTTAGDLAYATAANALARLGIGSALRYLRVNSGATAPEWVGGDESIGVIVTADHAITTATLTDITGMTVTATPDVTSTVLIWANVHLDGQDVDPLGVRLLFDGVLQSEDKSDTFSNREQTRSWAIWKSGVTSGSKIAKVQFSSDGTDTLTFMHGEIMVLMIPE